MPRAKALHALAQGFQGSISASLTSSPLTTS